MATYILKRMYAAVRNPYLERKSREELNESPSEVSEAEDLSSKDAAEKVSKNLKAEEDKTPVYQNLGKESEIYKTNKILDKDRNRLRNRTLNQNININRNTNISNPAKEKEIQMNTQLKIAEMQQKSSENAGGVNEKLIEIQKTNPLKPISMNK